MSLFYLCGMNEELLEALEQDNGIMEINCLKGFLLLHPEALPVVFDAIETGSLRQQKNAGWVLMHVGKSDAAMLRPYAERCLELTYRFNDDRILRNLLDISFKVCEIASDDFVLSHLALYDRCLEIVMNECYAPGTRSNAISVLYRFCEAEPALSEEVGMVLSPLLDHGSAGLLHKVRRVLHAFGKKSHREP